MKRTGQVVRIETQVGDEQLLVQLGRAVRAALAKASNYPAVAEQLAELRAVYARALPRLKALEGDGDDA